MKTFYSFTAILALLATLLTTPGLEKVHPEQSRRAPVSNSLVSTSPLTTSPLSTSPVSNSSTNLHSTSMLVCPPGDITLTTQADVTNFTTNFPACTQLLGHLVIGPSADITNLNGLTGITDIAQGLIIQDNDLLTDMTGLNNLITAGAAGQGIDIRNNPLLTTIDLSGLTTVDFSSIFIFNNAALTSFDLPAGINSTTSTNSQLAIQSNPLLTSLPTFNNLTSISGQLVLDNIPNAALPDFPLLTSIGTRLFIQNNPNITSANLFPSLMTIESGIIIQNNPNLASMPAFPSLSILNGGQIDIRDNALLQEIDLSTVSAPNLTDIIIAQNAVLTDICLPSDLTTMSGQYNIQGSPLLVNICPTDNLTTVGGLFGINDAIDPDLPDFPNLTTIGAGIYFRNNSQITELPAFNSLANLNGGPIDIRDNDMIADIDFSSISAPNLTDIIIAQNDVLTDICLPSDLTTMSGQYNIQGSPLLVNICPTDNLTTVGSLFGILDAIDPDLPDFPNLTTIGQGIFFRNNSQITELPAFNSLTNLNGGPIDIRNNDLLPDFDFSSVSAPNLRDIAIFNNIVLTDVCLPTDLTTLSSSYNIQGNPLLANICPSDNLTSIGGSLAILDVIDPTLPDFPNLTTIDQGIYFRNNSQITQLPAFNSLTNINGTTRDIDIINNDQLTDFDLSAVSAPNLRYIAIDENDVLSSIALPADLTILTDQFQILNNPMLEFINDQDNLTSIGRYLRIENTILCELPDFPNLQSIGGSPALNDGINFTANHNITELKEFPSLIFFEEFLRIQNNPVLSDCAIQAVCDNLPGLMTVEISGNAGDCLDQPAVQNHCDNGPTIPPPITFPPDMTVTQGGSVTLSITNLPAGYDAVWYAPDMTTILYQDVANAFQYQVNSTITLYGSYAPQGSTCYGPLEAVVLTAVPLTFNLSHEITGTGANATVRFTVDNFTDIGSFQFSINWDPANLAYVSLTNTTLPNFFAFNDTQAGSGILTLSWFDGDFSGETYPDGTTLIEIVFSGLTQGTHPVEITSNPTPLEASSNFNILPVTVNQGSVLVADYDIGGLLVRKDCVTPVTDVTVTLSGDVNDSQAASGSYLFPDQPAGSDITITPEKDINHLECVTTHDILLIQKHILNQVPITDPYSLIAADPNNSGGITTFDQIRIRNLILGNSPDFPGNTSWRFVDKDFVFPDPNNPWATAFPESIDIVNHSGPITDADFIGVKIGDVSMCMETMNPAYFTVSASNETVVSGDAVIVSFMVENFADVTTMQFSINWDPAKLSFNSTANYGLFALAAGNFGIADVANGNLNLSWFDTNTTGISLPDGSIIFEVEFTALGCDNAPVMITGNPVSKEASDNNCLVYDINSVDGSVDISCCMLEVICPPPSLGTISCNDPIPTAATDEAEFEALGGDIADSPGPCGMLVITHQDVFTPPSPICDGRMLTRTYTIMDDNTTVTCTQTLTITPPNGPAIQCPADMTVECLSNIVAGTPTFTTDCSLTANVTPVGPTLQSGQAGCDGAVYTIVYTVEDECGLTDMCTQTWTLANNGPVISCPADMTVQCFSDIVVNANDATATTDCMLGVQFMVSAPVQDGDNDCPGTTYTYTYTATDECGRTDECEQVFTIENGAPVIVCPADMIVQCEADIVVDAANAMVTTSCGLGFVVWVDQPHITGARDCDGTTYEYTYHALDDCGRNSNCIQTITLQNDPPTITVPPGITVECAADIVTDPSDATVTTSCGEVLDVTIYAPVITGTADCHNTSYTYTYRVEDQCEREATADRIFTIQNNPPVVTAPDDTTCECFAAINTNGANASVDVSCELGYEVTTSVSLISGTQDCNGTSYSVTYTAEDDCGREASASQTLTLQNGPPVFVNAPSVPLQLNCEDQGWEDIIQAWLASIEAKNSCGLPLSVSNNYNPNNQGLCIYNGTVVVTFFATDQCLRTSTTTGMIIIADTEPPVFMEEAQDELDICNYNTPHEFDDWVAAHGNAQALDGCWGNNISWSTIPNNPSFPNCTNMMGSTSMTVTFVVRDDCGNKASTTATFTAMMAGGDLGENEGGEVEDFNELGFALYQNQPNPFKNETLISFNLPEATAATLTVYDISGKVIKVEQGGYSAGYHEILINRSELSSAGMFYYELRTATDSAVKKMIILD